MTNNRKSGHILYLFGLILALTMAMAIGILVLSEVKASTNQTLSGSTTGFHSAIDTYVSSEPQGYGIYEERQSNVFRPGEPIILYVEPEGMTYGPVTEGNDQLYRIKMSGDITISDKQGNTLAELTDLPVMNIVSHHQNKELILKLTVEQSSPFPPGEYVIKYVVTDNISGESFEIIKDVSISG